MNYRDYSFYTLTSAAQKNLHSWLHVIFDLLEPEEQLSNFQPNQQYGDKEEHPKLTHIIWLQSVIKQIQNFF